MIYHKIAGEFSKFRFISSPFSPSQPVKAVLRWFLVQLDHRAEPFASKTGEAEHSTDEKLGKYRTTTYNMTSTLQTYQNYTETKVLETTALHFLQGWILGKAIFLQVRLHYDLN